MIAGIARDVRYATRRRRRSPVHTVTTVGAEVAVIETMAVTDVFARYFHPFRVSAFVLACLGLGAVAMAGLGVY